MSGALRVAPSGEKGAAIGADDRGGGADAEECATLSVLAHVMLDHRRLEAAAALLELLTVLSPERDYALRTLVYVRLQAGEYERALETAAEYRRLHTGGGLANTVLTLLESRALWALDRRAEARERLREYLEMSATL